MNGNVWILLGVIAGAFSLFAIPHGFQLNDKQKQSPSNSETENTIRVNRVAVAKLKIERAFKDFNDRIKRISENFPKESEMLASQYNVRGMLTSGPFVKAQMDLSVSVKLQLDKEYDGLKRQIEDILVENLGVTTLQLAGKEFNPEQMHLEEDLRKSKALYPLLNNNAKSWEMRSVRQDAITKNFDVANFN